MSIVVVISGSVSGAHRGFPQPFAVTRARLRAGSCRSERCVRPRLAPRPAFPGKSYAEEQTRGRVTRPRLSHHAGDGWRMGKLSAGWRSPDAGRVRGHHLISLLSMYTRDTRGAMPEGRGWWRGSALFTRSLGGGIVNTDQPLTLAFFLPPRQFTGTGWSQVWLGWIINQPRINCWWQIAGIR